MYRHRNKEMIGCVDAANGEWYTVEGEGEGQDENFRREKLSRTKRLLFITAL